MFGKLGLCLLWIGFIVYILFLAPPLHLEATLTLLKNILTLQWTDINPVILSLFSLIGIWLLIYSGILFIDGRMQWISFWPFAVASVAAGVLGLLPYLAFRNPNREFLGRKDAFLQLLDSPWYGLILSISTISLLAYAVSLGNWEDFSQQFQSDRFIHGMSLAFCLFAFLFPTIFKDDMSRRYWESRSVFWVVTLIPLFGPLIYLCTRPSLAENSV